MSGENAPDDDLRSLLANAHDDHLSSTALSDGVVKPANDDVASKDAGSDTSADGGDRERGQDGKFVKKDDGKSVAKESGKDADKASAKSDDKTEADKAKDGAKADAKADGADKQAADEKDKDADAKGAGKEPPSNWSASDKAMFKLQPPDAQEFLLRRHAAMQSDYDKKTAAIADLRKEYEPVQKLFSPHLEVMKSKGLSPSTIIQRWADVENQLMTGRGIDIIDGLVKGYQIDKAALAKRLGFTSSPSGGQGTEQQQGADQPGDEGAQALSALEQRLAKMFEPKLAKIDMWERSQQLAREAAARESETQVETDITNFKSATNEKGEPKHPYFDEVEPAMIALAQSYVASKQPLPPLAELYETAVWANPSTRAALLATQRAAENAKATEEARAKAASARRAASSVTGAPGSGQATRQVRSELSLREQLVEAAADLSG